MQSQEMMIFKIFVRLVGNISKSQKQECSTYFKSSKNTQCLQMVPFDDYGRT